MSSQIEDFIKTHRLAFSSDLAFEKGVRNIIAELNQFPDDNKHQLEFYNLVLTEFCNPKPQISV